LKLYLLQYHSSPLLWNNSPLQETCGLVFSYYLCFYVGIYTSVAQVLVEVFSSCVLSAGVLQYLIKTEW
jgi:hypothetical protein